MATEGTLLDVSLKMLQDGSFSDMTVVCKDRTWKCHRIVLCPRCPFFDAACHRGFKEAETLVVRLDEDPAEGVDVLLEFLYTLGPPNFDKTAGKTHLRAEYAFVLGDKYGLTDLRNFGRDMLLGGIEDDFKLWEKKTSAQKQEMVDRLERIWTWDQKDLLHMRELSLTKLSTMSVAMLEDKRFAKLVWENRVFGTAFMKHIFLANRR